MGKKRAREEAASIPAAENRDGDRMDEDEEESDDDEHFHTLQIEFEWFNFAPDIDFHGTKSLLRQLFDVDASLFDTSALADLILSQPTIGSAVKVDGKENDPYAILTVLNTHEHRANESMKKMMAYLAEKARANDSLAAIDEVIKARAQVGLILSERLINVPSEISAPMYSMLIDEMEAAVEDKEPYEFSHYLIMSRAFHEIESTLDADDRKPKKAREERVTQFFHPEDEIFHKHALAYGNFVYTKEGDVVSDSKRAFQEVGIQTIGHMMLVEGSKFEGAVKEINALFKPQQPQQ
ncbi:protein BCP1 [Hirsutella rhossiliensis]|uniref:Protein BCP1 n=1 Tax=Hirsutella rhossiliensis TaxID=111463 RepID=A0A9P8N229_9HYPO|nr:protein BCP1 [Hirsutella rhossiliensis]KAH0965507.1 protein BCP1 [Hirsutella rhossiliensis]